MKTTSLLNHSRILSLGLLVGSLISGTGTVHASACSQLKLSGQYTCDLVDFGSFDLSIKQSGKRFNIHAGSTSSVVITADGSKKPLATGDTEKNESYVAECSEDSLLIEHLVDVDGKTVQSGNTRFQKMPNDSIEYEAMFVDEEGNKTFGVKSNCLRK